MIFFFQSDGPFQARLLFRLLFICKISFFFFFYSLHDHIHMNQDKYIVQKCELQIFTLRRSSQKISPFTYGLTLCVLKVRLKKSLTSFQLLRWDDVYTTAFLSKQLSSPIPNGALTFKSPINASNSLKLWVWYSGSAHPKIQVRIWVRACSLTSVRYMWKSGRMHV